MTGDSEMESQGKCGSLLSWVLNTAYKHFLSSARNIMWIVAVSTCCFFMIKQMTHCLNKLSNPPISTQTRILMVDTIAYPAVTFCYKNLDSQGYDLAILQSYNVSDYWSVGGLYKIGPWEDFPFGTVNLSTLWKDSTFGLSEQDGPWRDKEKDLAGAEGTVDKTTIEFLFLALNQKTGAVNYTSRYMNDHGKCYTFKPERSDDDPVPGEVHGYQFIFHIKDGDQTSLPGGWNVYIHDPNEWWAENPLLPHSQQEMLYVPTGLKANIRLTESNFNELDKAHDHCTRNSKTSYTECLERCRWRHIAGLPGIQCSLPVMPVPGYPECNTHDSAISAMIHYWNWTDETFKLACETECVKSRSCTFKIYSSQITRTNDLPWSEFSIFHIYFPTGIIQDMHEEWSYDITLFIADFGGSMGFLLGVSILSVLEIVEGIFISIYQLIRQRKEDKQREEEEEQDHESTKLADKTSENNTSIQTEIDNNNDQMTVT